MKMDAGGKEKLTAFTTRMKGKQAAIIVNNRLLMAPHDYQPYIWWPIIYQRRLYPC